MTQFHSVLAHATLVLVRLELSPNPPQVAQPVKLQLSLQTALQLPVEDAKILLELRPKDNPQALPISYYLTESEPGFYDINLNLPTAGVWDAYFRDQTFTQEEATAHVDLVVYDDVSARALEAIEFIFPPTATGPTANSLKTWLIWVIALPILAGVAVTILVLSQSKSKDKA
ncbi:MAG: hypothetical protein R2880_12410 [Deinococcales bacterium]